MHSILVGIHAIHTVHSGDVVMSSIEETINMSSIYKHRKKRRHVSLPHSTHVTHRLSVVLALSAL